MPTVRNRSPRPVDLSTGRILAPSESATITITAHDQALIDTFALEVTDPLAPAPPSGPQVGYVQVDRVAAADGEVLYVDSTKPGGFDARPLPSEGGRGFQGPAATVEPLIAALSPGQEYVWLKTNGSGTLLDIVTGVK